MRALPRRSMPGALGSVPSFLVKAEACYLLARARSCVNRQTLLRHWLQNGCSGHAWLFPVHLRLEMPCATRSQPQQPDAVSEHPPSKQVGRFILPAFLFAALSAALAARPPLQCWAQSPTRWHSSAKLGQSGCLQHWRVAVAG